MKQFKEFINESKEESVNEGIIYDKRWDVAVKKHGNDTSKIKEVEAEAEGAESLKVAANDLAKTLGFKLQSTGNNARDPEIVLTKGSNTSLSIKDTNYGNYIRMTLFVRDLSQKDLDALSKVLKQLKLF